MHLNQLGCWLEKDTLLRKKRKEAGWVSEPRHGRKICPPGKQRQGVTPNPASSPISHSWTVECPYFFFIISILQMAYYLSKCLSKEAIWFLFPWSVVGDASEYRIQQDNFGEQMWPGGLTLRKPRLWWIKRMKYIYTYIHIMEYHSAIKMNEIMPFVTMWKDLEIIILSKVGQKEKNKQHMIPLI